MSDFVLAGFGTVHPIDDDRGHGKHERATSRYRPSVLLGPIPGICGSLRLHGLDAPVRSGSGECVGHHSCRSRARRWMWSRTVDGLPGRVRTGGEGDRPGARVRRTSSHAISTPRVRRRRLRGAGRRNRITGWCVVLVLAHPSRSARNSDSARGVRARPSAGWGLLVGFVEGATVGTFDHAVTTAHRWPVAELSQVLLEAGFEVLEAHTRTGSGHRPHGAITARRQNTR